MWGRILPGKSRNFGGKPLLVGISGWVLGWGGLIPSQSRLNSQLNSQLISQLITAASPGIRGGGRGGSGEGFGFNPSFSCISQPLFPIFIWVFILGGGSGPFSAPQRGREKGDLGWGGFVPKGGDNDSKATSRGSGNGGVLGTGTPPLGILGTGTPPVGILGTGTPPGVVARIWGLRAGGAPGETPLGLSRRFRGVPGLLELWG